MKRLRKLLADLARKVSSSRALSRATSMTWAAIKKEFKQDGFEESLNQCKQLEATLDAIETDTHIVLRAKQTREKELAKNSDGNKKRARE